jgi:thiol-disulfide isomerase/thioredoxin
MKDTAVAEAGQPFTMDERGITGDWESRKIRMTNKPALVGTTTVEEILAYSYTYQEGMDRYAPSEKDVAYLKSFTDPVRVEVFFGSWCPHCKEIVPKLFKCMKLADNPRIDMSLTGVPDRNFSAYGPAKEKNIQGVPTFIIYAGTREIGRFSAVPGDSSIEHELVRILAAWRAVSG